jgi:hypothetical protein
MIRRQEWPVLAEYGIKCVTMNENFYKVKWLGPKLVLPPILVIDLSSKGSFIHCFPLYAAWLLCSYSSLKKITLVRSFFWSSSLEDQTRAQRHGDSTNNTTVSNLCCVETEWRSWSSGAWLLWAEMHVIVFLVWCPDDAWGTSCDYSFLWSIQWVLSYE